MRTLKSPYQAKAGRWSRHMKVLGVAWVKFQARRTPSQKTVYAVPALCLKPEICVLPAEKHPVLRLFKLLPDVLLCLDCLEPSYWFKGTG